MATRGFSRQPNLVPAMILATLALALVLGGLATLATSPTKADAPPSSLARWAIPQAIGSGSCAAKGCHGGVGAADPGRGEVAFAGAEFTTWKTFDPHARAYRTLLTDRSRAMAKRLFRQLDNKAAHEAPACLSCHAPRYQCETEKRWGAGNAPPNFRDGVGCESCHGPASIWKDAHVSASWRAKEAGAKVEAGMADLSKPWGRARTCVECHVGEWATNREVNHDFLAAGHPRLRFEYTSALAAYPKHWREPVTNDESQGWAIGQVVTAKAGVDVLVGRATEARGNGPAPWPEFAEYACFSCHRDLPATVGGPPVSGPPLPWATWPLAMLPALAEGRPEVDPDSPRSVWAPLRAAMTRDEPDPAEVVRLARDCSLALDGWIAALVREPSGGSTAEALMGRLATGFGPGRSESWDAAAQRYLGLSALARSRGGSQSAEIPAEIRSSLEMAPKLLTFPTGYDGPRRGVGVEIPLKPGEGRR